ncbi:hypothetical protein SMACR_09159 [Sordaria macrospora]|uniref:WGS project CABT00000000 data, contig 2.74 n=2 Tax=Sordaria macrospora TaxID=5147 RepID=F7WBD7_SORMK|nr:uncharacterized protein SMAC_09159 [Sordaria macrospora k-hell]KAA8633992.1 hypothetical protein SMACR_09159 [Sordaria macrospora]KAH7629622.1 hypothetical protein B0T09DRAFT_384598 [Sordaria sp. MPI-SDFR-AT-0083]WPJ66172.1 hypothetical protein SMAC4_09159 [Sordaria macrospora]CCC14948.1 unnamed protein product [Sordaria macrospora k-hell]
MATTANLLRSRAVPLGIAGGLGGIFWWQTRGGKNQPRGVSEKYAANDTGNATISEHLQNIGGTGGTYARKGPLEEDPKDTRVVGHSPAAHSKRNPEKTGTAPEGHTTGAGRKDSKDYGGNKV